MPVQGTFEVQLTPQDDEGAPAGRMLIAKTYRGDMTGSGTGQMISKRTEQGSAVYFAIEEFTGSVRGTQGSFTLLHQGRMSPESQVLEITILEGSGAGGLEHASGSMRISQDEQGHGYELELELG